MILMQGNETFVWWWCETILTIMPILCVWYFVISGRDRRPNKQRNENEIERYGSLEQNEAPLTKFLIWTYVGTAFFIVSYLIWTGISGIQF
jgi:hypothetical protein